MFTKETHDINVHGIFIYNSSKLLTTKMSYNRWLAKQMVAYPYQGIPLSIKKEPTIDKCNNLVEFEGYYAEWKTSILKGYILYNFIP